MADPRLISGVRVGGAASPDPLSNTSSLETNTKESREGASLGVSSAAVTGEIPEEAWTFDPSSAQMQSGLWSHVVDLDNGPVIPEPSYQEPLDMPTLARSVSEWSLTTQESLQILLLDEVTEGSASAQRTALGGAAEEELSVPYTSSEYRSFLMGASTSGFDWNKEAAGFGIAFAMSRLAFIRLMRLEKKDLRFASYNLQMGHKEFQILMQKVENRFARNNALYNLDNVKKGAEIINDRARRDIEAFSQSPFSTQQLRKMMDETYAELDEGVEHVDSKSIYGQASKQSNRKVEKKASEYFAPAATSLEPPSTQPEAKTSGSSVLTVTPVTGASAGASGIALQSVPPPQPQSPQGPVCMPRNIFFPEELSRLPKEQREALQKGMLTRDMTVGQAMRLGRPQLFLKRLKVFMLGNPGQARQEVEGLIRACEQQIAKNKNMQQHLRHMSVSPEAFEANLRPQMHQIASGLASARSRLEVADALIRDLTANKTATPPLTVDALLQKYNYMGIDAKHSAKRDSLRQKIETAYGAPTDPIDAVKERLEVAIQRPAVREMEELIQHSSVHMEACVGLCTEHFHKADHTFKAPSQKLLQLHEECYVLKAKKGTPQGLSPDEEKNLQTKEKEYQKLIGTESGFWVPLYQQSVSKPRLQQMLGLYDKIKQVEKTIAAERLNPSSPPGYHTASLARQELELAQMQEEWQAFTTPNAKGEGVLWGLDKRLEKRKERLVAAWHEYASDPDRKGAGEKFFGVYGEWAGLEYLLHGRAYDAENLPEFLKQLNAAGVSRPPSFDIQAVPAPNASLRVRPLPGASKDTSALGIRPATPAPLSMSLRRTQSASSLGVRPVAESKADVSGISLQAQPPSASAPSVPFPKMDTYEKVLAFEAGKAEAMGEYFSPRNQKYGKLNALDWFINQISDKAVAQNLSVSSHYTQYSPMFAFAGMEQDNVGEYNRNVRALERATQGMVDRILSLNNAQLR